MKLRRLLGPRPMTADEAAALIVLIAILGGYAIAAWLA